MKGNLYDEGGPVSLNSQSRAERKAFAYFAGKALANPRIGSGVASEKQIIDWFGEHVTRATNAQITAEQACDAAEAMVESLRRRGIFK